MNKHPIGEPKNTRALNLIRSWLTAVGISHCDVGKRLVYKPDSSFNVRRAVYNVKQHWDGFKEDPEFRKRTKNAAVLTVSDDGVDLIVSAKGGTAFDLQVHATDSVEPHPGTLTIEAATITGRNIPAALEAFRGLVEFLGYEWKSPVDRGPAPKKKAYTADDFELGALRHADLRRVPNPSQEELKRFEAVVKAESHRFQSNYREICDDNMLDCDDLQTYAQMWTVAYLGMYRAADETNDGVFRKLTSHLRQRFQELRNLLHKKGRNVFANLDEAHIAQTGTPFNYSKTFSVGGGDGRRGDTGKRGPGASEHPFLQPEIAVDEEIDDAFVARRREIETHSEDARRTSSRKLLAKLLLALPHDEMVERLVETVENDRLDPGARKEAAHQLRLHAAGCPSCVELAPEVGEEASGVDSAGVEEQL